MKQNYPTLKKKMQLSVTPILILFEIESAVFSVLPPMKPQDHPWHFAFAFRRDCALAISFKVSMVTTSAQLYTVINIPVASPAHWFSPTDSSACCSFLSKLFFPDRFICLL